MNPLDRFRMLETARPAAEPEPEPAAGHRAHAMSDRFAAVTAEQLPAVAPPPPAPAPPAPAPDPFAPPPWSDVAAYDLAPADARPTRRCAGCGFENARQAHEACAKCGEPLDTRAARHLHEKLQQDEADAAFARRRAAAAAVAEREARHAAADAENMQRVSLEVESPLPWFDRVVDRVACGPAATWPMPARRALVVALVAAVFAGLFMATHSAVIGFAAGLVVTIGLCLVAA